MSAIVLAVAASLTILVVSDGGGWRLAGLWILATIGITIVVAHRPSARIAIGLALIPICILLTFEGGLFFLPSTMLLLLSGLLDRSGPPRRARSRSPGQVLSRR